MSSTRAWVRSEARFRPSTTIKWVSILVIVFV